MQPPAEPPAPITPPAPAERACTHTIASGDTLWDIAGRYLGDPARWTEIYDANQAVIEAAAREHPGPPVSGTSDRGHWIFPGTVLTITGASCAPTTTPTTPTTETPPTSGGVSDAQACEAVGGIPAETQSGDFYCGKFSTLSATPKPFTQAELDQIQQAADLVGCVSDVAEIATLLSGVLAAKGFEVAQRALLAGEIATLINDVSSGNVALGIWKFIKPPTGEDCFKLRFDRLVPTDSGEGGGAT